MPGGFQLGGQFTPVPGHPNIVPAEHDNRQRENRGVEHLLPHAFERIRKSARENREKRRAENARCYASGHIFYPSQDALGGGKHDADDQAGLDHLPENDNCGPKHYSLLFDDQHALRGLCMIFALEGVAAGG